MMKDMRLRPRGDYLRAASWEELYALGEHWQSDMAYYKDELKFLYHLVDKYFKWLMSDNDIRKVQAMARDINMTDHEATRISIQVDEHQHQIAHFVRNAFSEDDREFREAHAQILSGTFEK